MFPVSEVLEGSRHAVDEELVTRPLGLKPGEKGNGNAGSNSIFIFLNIRVWQPQRLPRL